MEHLEHITELSDRSVAIPTPHIMSNNCMHPLICLCAHTASLRWEHHSLWVVHQCCRQAQKKAAHHSLTWARIVYITAHASSKPRLTADKTKSNRNKLRPCSHRASREFSIEKALYKMMADWEGLTFELGTWKNTGTFILKGEQYTPPHVHDAQRAAGHYRPFLLSTHAATRCHPARVQLSCTRLWTTPLSENVEPMPCRWSC